LTLEVILVQSIFVSLEQHTIFDESIILEFRES